MILYLDTSSLVKLYVEEDGSPEVRSAVDQAEVVATSVVALPEARSAFARLQREGALTPAQLDAVRRDLLQDWDAFLKVRVLKRVYERAGDLAEKRALRGFDALHLASYLEIATEAVDQEVGFSAFDERLNQAVAAERADRSSR